jgi:hypothetical protein
VHNPSHSLALRVQPSALTARKEGLELDGGKVGTGQTGPQPQAPSQGSIGRKAKAIMESESQSLKDRGKASQGRSPQGKGTSGPGHRLPGG